jgi:hypothetical protein
VKLYKLDAARSVVLAASVLEWGEALEHGEGRPVAVTRLPMAEVSTVFLGVNHRRFGEGPPLVFETAIFPRGALGSGVNIFGRWATWAEAEAGHDDACKAALAAHGETAG